MSHWIRELHALTEKNEPCVLISVSSTRGSAPREAGAKMIVTARQSIGTIGGGQLEYQCIRLACGWLQSGLQGRARLEKFPLGASCGQCCGGMAEVYFEEITAAQWPWVSCLFAHYADDIGTVMVSFRGPQHQPDKLIVTEKEFFAFGRWQTPSDVFLATARRVLQFQMGAKQVSAAIDNAGPFPVIVETVAGTDSRVFIFGAGHVGAACARALGAIDVRTCLVDSRTELLAGSWPENVQIVQTVDLARIAVAVPTGSICLVMTHDHQLDFDICVELLKRRDIRYCGLIGSATKRRRFEKRLRALDFSEQAVGRLTCPIGIKSISSKKPADIAISVAAQILEMRECAVTVQPARQQARAG